MFSQGAARYADVSARRVFVIVAAAVLGGMAYAQESPRLVGPSPFPQEVQVPPLANPLTNDQRPMRSFPEQPPIIPHSIEGYQITLTTNPCLSCHSRQYVEGSGAPMISVTHYENRDGQMLADVSPRRYFCTMCHVGQTDTRPTVENRFVDMLGVEPSARQ